MKISFVGAGNMGEALMAGFVQSGAVKAESILAYDPACARLQHLCTNLGIRAATCNEECISQADVVFLAVKPHLMEEVLRPLGETLRKKRPLLISIAAATSLASLHTMVEDAQLPIIRILPNLGVGINAGLVAFCAGQHVSTTEVERAKDLLENLGRVIPMAEDMLTTFSSVGAASYAFVCMFIDALAKAGLKEGMPKNQGLEIASQAVLGAAQLCLKDNVHPLLLMDKICSPNGTTICGVKALEEGAFVGTIMQAVAATSARDLEILASKKS